MASSNATILSFLDSPSFDPQTVCNAFHPSKENQSLIAEESVRDRSDSFSSYQDVDIRVDVSMLLSPSRFLSFFVFFFLFPLHRSCHFVRSAIYGVSKCSSLFPSRFKVSSDMALAHRETDVIDIYIRAWKKSSFRTDGGNGRCRFYSIGDLSSRFKGFRTSLEIA